MSDTVMAVQARFPERLLDEAKALVKQGWFEDLDSVLQEALRRYLDTHRSEMLDRFVREDVAWGLGGKD
jgi:Arc/MetJ-type ribon-helix-helix transcriptional regulator